MTTETTLEATSLDTMDDNAEYTTCDNCLESVLLSDTDDDCYCPACQQVELDRLAEEAKEEAIAEAQEAVDDAQGDVDSLESELEDLLADVAAKRAEITEAKKTVKVAEKALAKLN